MMKIHASGDQARPHMGGLYRKRPALRRVMVSAAAVTLSLILASCGNAAITNPLYLQLQGIMEERKQLWSIAVAKGGTRERDISYLVCPLVTEQAMEEMYAVPEIAKTMQYEYIETSQVYPPNSRRWTLLKPLELGSGQVLSIRIASGNYCRVTYRHMR